MRIRRWLSILLILVWLVILALLYFLSSFFISYEPAVGVWLMIVTVCLTVMPILFRKPASGRLMRSLRYLSLCVFLIAFSYVAFTFLPVSLPWPAGAPALAFQGNSSDVKHTRVVPTFDTPLQAEKNILWYASFQATWDALRRDKLEGAPVRLAASQTIADRLNKAQLTSEVLPPEHYAVAGCASEDFLNRIKQETTTRFPEFTFFLADSDALPADATLLAYAFLRAHVPFRLPYKREKAGMLFEGGNGQSKQVGAFGLRQADRGKYSDLREQVQVLYVDDVGARPEEYLLDISLGSDIQLLLARVPRGDTLQATWDYIQSKIASVTSVYPWDKHFFLLDILLVPEMNWKLNHHFKELEGKEKALLNPVDCGGYISQARQVVSFTLDSSGARLRSETLSFDKHPVRHFVFDKPFLLALQRRDADTPYFVMWVDNPELLSPV